MRFSYALGNTECADFAMDLANAFLEAKFPVDGTVKQMLSLKVIGPVNMYHNTNYPVDSLIVALASVGIAAQPVPGREALDVAIFIAPDR